MHLLLRLAHIEDLLGACCISVCGTRIDKLFETFISLCRDILNCDVTEHDFIVVPRLDNKCTGFLLRLSSPELKKRKMANALTFNLRGIGVWLRWCANDLLLICSDSFDYIRVY